MTEYFHQFVRIEQGVVNSIIIDFLHNKLFHIDNVTIKKFYNNKYNSIQDFVNRAREEKLLIKIKERTWIPYFNFKKEKQMENNINYLTLEVDEGVNLEIIKRKINYISNAYISRIITYGKNKKINAKKILIKGNIIKQIYKKKNFKDCVNKSEVKPWLTKELNVYKYQFNMSYNSCWGKKIAISNEGNVRPCIYSHLSLGNFYNQPTEEVIERLTKYWNITKDNIEICKDCEFRYLCFNCPEYNYIKTNDLYKKNPSCSYNPYSGKWIS